MCGCSLDLLQVGGVGYKTNVTKPIVLAPERYIHIQKCTEGPNLPTKRIYN